MIVYCVVSTSSQCACDILVLMHYSLQQLDVELVLVLREGLCTLGHVYTDTFSVQVKQCFKASSCKHTFNHTHCFCTFLSFTLCSVESVFIGLHFGKRFPFNAFSSSFCIVFV